MLHIVLQLSKYFSTRSITNKKQKQPQQQLANKMKQIIFSSTVLAILLLGALPDGARSSPSAIKTAVGVATATAASALAATSNTEQSNDDKELSSSYLCLPPKSCSIKESNSGNSNINTVTCSYDTLQGIMLTRQRLQMQQQQLVQQDINYSFDTVIGLKMRLANIRLEEASVGCALLQHHDKSCSASAFENGNDSIICPKPKSCWVSAKLGLNKTLTIMGPLQP